MKRVLIFFMTGLLVCTCLLAKTKETPVINDISPNISTAPVIAPNRDTWDILYYFFDIDAGNPGLETNGTHIFTSDWRTGYVTFHKFDMIGTFIEEFDIAGATCIRDMAYDGTYFYGSSASMTINIMDLEAQTLIGTIPVTCAGVSGVRHIAYDPTLDDDNGGFWIGNWDELGAITMSGAQIYGNINPTVQSLYGNAYDPWTADGPYLWLFSQTGGSVIHQFEIATQTFTGVTHNCSDVPGFDDGIAGGAATYVNDVDLFVLLVNIQQDPNLIAAYELAPTAHPLAPGPPTDVVVTPDAGGALEAQIDWVCPTVQVNGEPLTDLDEMRVYRDDVLIYTDTTPVIGGPGSYLDTAVPASGIIYAYKVIGFNDFGEGLGVTVSTWVGEDVPNLVENLLLVQTSPGVLSGTLTWDNPTTGLNGGAFNEPILGYHIVRYPDIVPFGLTGIATEYIDNTIPISDVYWYTVQAYNLVGDGGTETSNAVLFAGPGLLIMEDFSGGVPPAGWYIDGLGQENWSASASVNAGGTSPELRFSWSPTFTGISRMCTMPVNTEGFNELILDFKHSINHYGGAYTLGVVTTSDGATWNTAWELIDPSSIPATTETIVINTPDVGSPTFQMAFFFDGYSWNINYWYIDDVLLETLEHGDVAGVVTDNVTALPIEGVEVWIEGYPSDFTNAAGEYLLETITTGMRDIFATKDGYYNYQGVVEVLPDVVVTYDIGMDPAVLGALDGTVTDADTGDPLVGAEINAISDAGYEYDAVTNDDGYYLIENMVAETYDVTCTLPMYIPQTVEDVVIDPGTTVTLDFVLQLSIYYFSDFEDNDGYLLSNNPNGWQWGAPTSGPGVAYSGINVWATVLGAAYANSANWTLETTIPVGVVSTAYMLDFWHWYDIEGYGYDGGNVKISTDGGTSWSVITPLTGYPGVANTSNPLSGEPIFWESSAGWVLVEFDLSAYVGENILVRWHFGTDSSVTYPGWYIDDVRIYEQAFGSLEGYVTEFDTGIPIAGAEITIGLYSGTSGDDGHYFIDGIVAGTYDVECEAAYYLPAFIEDVVIEASTTTNLDIVMLWSEIAVNVTELVSNLDPDETEVQTFIITNEGPGDLVYDITFDYPVEFSVRKVPRIRPVSNPRESLNSSEYTKTSNNISNVRKGFSINDRDPNASSHTHGTPPTDDIFDFQFSYPVGVGGGEAGMECDGNYLYTTKWNGNAFYKYELDGTYVGQFTVSGCPGSIRDLAYDGQYFYGGAASSTVYEMDFDAQTTISTINAPIAVRAIAYDPVNDGFWANNWSDTITLFDRSGNTLDSFPCGSFSSYYGFAWEDVLPGGPYLWGYSQVDGSTGNTIVQIEIATGLETGVNCDLNALIPNTSVAGGLYITDAIVEGKWTIGGTMQNEIIWGVELADAENWVSITNNASGTVLAYGGTITVDVTFDATDLTAGTVLTADLLIHNNSNYVATRGDDYVIPVTLNVSGALAPPTNLNVDEYTGLFTWDPPDLPPCSREGDKTKAIEATSRDLLGYNVYLDDMVEPIGSTTFTEWQYVDLVYLQEYIAGVSAVYDEGESIVVEFPFTYLGTGAGNDIPLITELSGNFPNPFNPDTEIKFSIKDPGHVTLNVFNIRGQLVKTLVNEKLEPKHYSVIWDGKDNSGKSVSSGIYFYKMKAEKYTSTKKMILMK